MHFVTNHTFERYMTKEDSAKLMEVFAARGEAPGTTAHYVWTNGRGGTVIVETDDLAAVCRNLLEYNEWLDFDSQTVLPISDAVPQIADYLG